MKKSFAQMLNDSQADLRRKFFRKVGSWASVDGIVIPGKLCTEQCSSEQTAVFKASVALKIAGKGATLADLTGGLGVDSWAFARMGLNVRYNEMNPVLAEAAATNFNRLGLPDISISSVEVNRENVRRLLEACGPVDIAYLDPARRDSSGKKVFLLEDCSPDIVSLKDSILEICPDILLKLSPMADISMVAGRLGNCVREVYVVESERECKELLVWMHRGWNEGWAITVTDTDDSFTFTRKEEASARIRLPLSPSVLTGMRIFEPGPAMLKAGPYKLLCSRLGLLKLGIHTHLYAAYDSGRPVSEVHHLDRSAIKTLGKRFPKCDVTARNVPMTSEELRKRMGVSGGGDVHIYAVTCDFEAAPSERILLVTLNP